MDWPASAGEGEPEYLLPKVLPPSPDTAALTPRKHYVAVDALTWFVNKDPAFWNERMVSGTVEIVVGEETFKVALGTYDLEDDTHKAPAFNKTLLDSRAYRGGNIRLQARIQGIQQDNAMGGILRSVSAASLNVVSGAVSTASVAGPAVVLKDAGTALVAGVQKVLAEGKKGFAVFPEQDGISVDLLPSEIVGPTTYVLLHNGNGLNNIHLKVLASNAGDFEVWYDQRLLDDGAWILFRIRRSVTYGSERPWEAEAKRTRNAIDDLMAKWDLGSVTTERAIEQLTSFDEDNPTIADQVSAVCTLIGADYVLVERETLAFATAMRGLQKIAKKAAQDGTYATYLEERTKFVTDLEAGGAPTEAVTVEVATAERARLSVLASTNGRDALEIPFIPRGSGRSRPGTESAACLNSCQSDPVCACSAERSRPLATSRMASEAGSSCRRGLRGWRSRSSAFLPSRTHTAPRRRSRRRP